MNETQWIELAAKYGMTVVAPVLIMLGAAWIVRYTFQESAKRETLGASREERMALLLTNHLHSLSEGLTHLTDTLSTMDRNAREFYQTEVKEANRRQRDEHTEMLDEVRRLRDRG